MTPHPTGLGPLRRLDLSPNAYTLSAWQDGSWQELARLDGGAGHLLPAKSQIDDYRLEVAIQHAEDWIGPHAQGMHGQVLEVNDTLGRMREGLQTVLGVQAHSWDIEGIEQCFRQAVDLATGRVVPAALRERWEFMADLLLVRELAHHGKVAAIDLVQPI